MVDNIADWLDSQIKDLNEKMATLQTQYKDAEKKGFNTDYFLSEIDRINTEIETTYKVGNKILDIMIVKGINV